MADIDPAAKAKWVLETKSVGEIPALSLKAVAESESVKYLLKPYAGGWDGVLAFKGEQRAILVNTSIDYLPRHNFTFAHELGHYFLEHQPSDIFDGHPAIRCTAADFESEGKIQEVQANRFAVEFLMPEERFRLDMVGAPIDFDLIKSLSKKHMVSKHACSNRILALIQSPCIVIRTAGMKISGYMASASAKQYLKNLVNVPLGTASYAAIQNQSWQADFVRCNPAKWLEKGIAEDVLYECTRGDRKSGTAMTILKW